MSKYYINPIGLLHEMFATYSSKPKFVLVEESGPGHSLTYGYQVPLFYVVHFASSEHVFP